METHDEQRIVRLSRDDDGTEVWLDTQTGQQLTGVVERDETAPSHPMIATATAVFDELKWRSDLLSDRHVCCRVRAEHASYLVRLQAYDDNPALLCAVEIAVHVPGPQLDRALDYLNRINWGLRLGNFELDPRDGEVRFRLTIVPSGGPIAGEVVGRMVNVALSTCERFFPGLMKVVFAAANAADAMGTADS